MGHWFDDLTTQLALGKLTRRDAFLAACTGLGSALFGIDSARAQVPVPQPPKPVPPIPPTPGSPCTVTVKDRQGVFTFASRTTINGKAAVLAKTITKTFGVRGGATGRTVLSFAGTSLFDIDSRLSEAGPAPPMTVASVHFADGITGIRGITLTSVDGKTLSGEVDGRAIVPFPIAAVPASVQFQDGKPAPVLNATPQAETVVRTLLARVRTEVPLCKPSQNLGRPAPITPFDNPANTGRSDDTYGTASCRDCLGACAGIGLAAVAGCCAATLGLGCAFCAGAGAAAEAFCIHQCQTSTDCCPVPCGEVACCFGGDTCLDSNRGVCCAPGLVGCHSRECCGGSDTCLPDGTCCPQGQAVCNNVCCQSAQACSTENICCQQFQPNVPPVSCRGSCCAADEVCKDGVACCPPNDPICKGVCCRGGSCDSDGNCCALLTNGGKLCGGTCCPVFSTCCGTTCCGGDSRCINGGCCPSAQVCGSVCCPAGQACQDPNTGRCGGCASGLVPCVPIDSSTPVCCPAGASCCAGQCCPSGQICCDVAGVFGCHTEQVCIP